MIKTMTLAEARKAYPIDTMVQVVQTARIGRVTDHYAANVAFIGRRTYVSLNTLSEDRPMGEFTTDEIEAI